MKKITSILVVTAKQLNKRMYSGITKEMMDRVTTTLRDVQGMQQINIYLEIYGSIHTWPPVIFKIATVYFFMQVHADVKELTATPQKVATQVQAMT
nr:hypothetical protein [Tanacetum cinerariifolium]